MQEVDDCRETYLVRPRIIITATVPFAVNAFLEGHITELSRHYQIVLCTNLSEGKILSNIENKVLLYDVSFARKISLLSDLKSLIKLFKIIGQCKPVAVHSITPKAGLLTMVAGAIHKVRNRWHTFTGQVWATKRGLARYLLRAMDRLIVVSATQVFADSPSQCRLLSDEGVVRDGNICVLGSGSIAGVNLARFRPDSLKRSSLRKKMSSGEACIFLFVGRLVRDKGVFDLIQAFKEVAETAHNIELWMVGPDEDCLAAQLREVGSNSLAPIRWFEMTDTPEHFMAAADVLVLPSYREGFGSVIIEAAACGLPAIAYRVDGVVDALDQGNSGLLVEARNVSAFAEAMKQLACNTELRSRLGSQARKRAVRDFDSRRISEAWLSFYDNRLGCKDLKVF